MTSSGALSQEIRRAVISHIVRFDLLRRDEFRESFLPAKIRQKLLNHAKRRMPSCWDIIYCLSKAYLSNQTLATSDIYLLTGLSRTTAGRAINMLAKYSVVQMEKDQGDKRRTRLALDQKYFVTLDNYVQDCFVEFEELISHHHDQERTKAIEALAISERARIRLIEAIEYSPVGMILWDDEQKFVWCNEIYKQLRPIAAKILVPGIEFEVFSQKIGEKFNALKPRNIEHSPIGAIAKLPTKGMEWEDYTIDGRWILVHGKHLPDGGIIVFHTDITERKTAENNQRILFEQAEDSIFIINPKTNKFIDVNNNACRRLGYNREELLALGPEDIGYQYDPNSRAAVELEKTGSAFVEMFHVRKDKSKFPVHISGQVIELEGQKVYQCYVRDISEQKVAEETIGRFIDAMEKMPEGIIIWDADDKFVMCNEKFKKMRPNSANLLTPGTSFEDYIRKRAWSGSIKETKNREDDWINERIESRRKKKFEEHVVHIGGRVFRIKENTLRDGGVINLHVDITDQLAGNTTT